MQTKRSKTTHATRFQGKLSGNNEEKNTAFISNLKPGLTLVRIQHWLYTHTNANLLSSDRGGLAIIRTRLLIDATSRDSPCPAHIGGRATRLFNA
jgi:hypothetical protein